ncbi:uncharacterized protein LOC123257280 [Drosophila ananassae]|uniref:uncharacterized protein LOC123257280 n=1 Tax=Drosophila ananassae TaxID=7217 RepID=UPI001D0011EB|nr:uncharacterized protein LOC123257280 [Drosophila ananassae]
MAATPRKNSPESKMAPEENTSNHNTNGPPISIGSSIASLNNNITTSPRVSWFSSDSNPDTPPGPFELKHIPANPENHDDVESDSPGERGTDPLSTSTPKAARKPPTLGSKPGPRCSKRRKTFPLSLSRQKRAKPTKMASNDNPIKMIPESQSILSAPTPTAKNDHNTDAPTTSKNAQNHGSQPTPPNASEKIPAIFLHNVTSIQPILETINTIPGVSNTYTTTSLSGNRVKLTSNNFFTYQHILEKLETDKLQTHTHQPKSERGYRIIIRQLHHSTPCEDIRRLLSDLGYAPRYINNIKHRRSRKPMDLFEAELAPAQKDYNEKILAITKLGNQRVTIERQLRRLEPPMCHRCQRYGHTKNFCRRDFVCLKCAGNHPSTACAQTKLTNPKCANCGLGHVASYKGCAAFKQAQTRLTAYRAHKALGTHRAQQQPRKGPTTRPNYYGHAPHPNLPHLNQELDMSSWQSPSNHSPENLPTSQTTTERRNPFRQKPKPATKLLYSQAVNKYCQNTPVRNPAETHLRKIKKKILQEQRTNSNHLNPNTLTSTPSNRNYNKENNLHHEQPPPLGEEQRPHIQPPQENAELKCIVQQSLTCIVTTADLNDYGFNQHPQPIRQRYWLTVTLPILRDTPPSMRRPPKHSWLPGNYHITSNDPIARRSNPRQRPNWQRNRHHCPGHQTKRRRSASNFATQQRLINMSHRHWDKPPMTSPLAPKTALRQLQRMKTPANQPQTKTPEYADTELATKTPGDAKAATPQFSSGSPTRRIFTWISHHSPGQTATSRQLLRIATTAGIASHRHLHQSSRPGSNSAAQKQPINTKQNHLDEPLLLWSLDQAMASRQQPRHTAKACQLAYKILEQPPLTWPTEQTTASRQLHSRITATAHQHNAQPPGIATAVLATGTNSGDQATTSPHGSNGQPTRRARTWISHHRSATRTINSTQAATPRKALALQPRRKHQKAPPMDWPPNLRRRPGSNIAAQQQPINTTQNYLDQPPLLWPSDQGTASRQQPRHTAKACQLAHMFLEQPLLTWPTENNGVQAATLPHYSNGSPTQRTATWNSHCRLGHRNQQWRPGNHIAARQQQPANTMHKNLDQPPPLCHKNHQRHPGSYAA